MTRSFAGMTVLIVEDESFLLLDLETAFEERGARALGASTFAEGVRIAEREGLGLDLAVLDIDLPDGQIFPLASCLQGRGVPIVFHSGRADADAIARDFPGADLVMKPGQQRLLLSKAFDRVRAAAA